MAEDVLRMAGFIEGVLTISSRKPWNRHLAQTIRSAATEFESEYGREVPAQQLPALHRSQTDNDKKMNKGSIPEGCESAYQGSHNPRLHQSSDNTVDYVIVFIPNEQVYAFINENYHAILEEAMQNKVTICPSHALRHSGRHPSGSR